MNASMTDPERTRIRIPGPAAPVSADVPSAVIERYRRIIGKGSSGDVSTFDAAWAATVASAINHVVLGKWAAYRDDCVTMAALLEHEGKPQAALLKWLEVCYLDLNDVGSERPQMHTSRGCSMLEQPQGFESIEIDTTALARVCILAAQAKLSEPDLAVLFVRIAQGTRLSVQPLRSAEEAWLALRPQIFE